MAGTKYESPKHGIVYELWKQTFRVLPETGGAGPALYVGRNLDATAVGIFLDGICDEVARRAADDARRQLKYHLSQFADRLIPKE